MARWVTWKFVPTFSLMFMFRNNMLELIGCIGFLYFPSRHIAISNWKWCSFFQTLTKQVLSFYWLPGSIWIKWSGGTSIEFLVLNDSVRMKPTQTIINYNNCSFLKSFMAFVVNTLVKNVIIISTIQNFTIIPNITNNQPPEWIS